MNQEFSGVDIIAISGCVPKNTISNSIFENMLTPKELKIFEKTFGIKERRGADIIIQKIDGQRVKGELIAVKQNSLLLRESSSGADVTAVVSDMKTITIVKKSNTLKRGGLGLLLGSGLGALAGLMMVQQFNLDDEARSYTVFYGVAFGAGLGLLSGGISGALSAKDKTIQIEGNSEAEIKEILEDLRKKARGPNFQ